MKAELRWHHDKVVSIEKSVGPAMCVEVPGHGRFLQNGFDGSNSKGLEWENVFMAGCNEYLLPHARSEDMDEERRLFYVGVTRAKERLNISCVSEIAVGNKLRAADASPFIYEAGLTPTFVESNGEEEPPNLNIQIKASKLFRKEDNQGLFNFDDDDFDENPSPNAPFLKN